MRLLGRDREIEPRGCVAEMVRLIRSVACPRSGVCVVRLHGRVQEIVSCAVAWSSLGD